ncbi:MAG: glycosyltransferase [Saprospiraceae bacterium]|nr:glycosyltransferase [Saprospiraceae bacterium]
MKYISNYNVLHRIDFLGKVLRIDEFYASKYFCIPSDRRVPNALCEAMAAGLPCVSFDFVACSRDIIDNGKNGIIVEFE